MWLSPTGAVIQRSRALEIILARDRKLDDDVVSDSDVTDDVGRSHGDSVVSEGRVGVVDIVRLVRWDR